jgi:hypothetical protein
VAEGPARVRELFLAKAFGSDAANGVEVGCIRATVEWDSMVWRATVVPMLVKDRKIVKQQVNTIELMGMGMWRVGWTYCRVIRSDRYDMNRRSGPRMHICLLFPAGGRTEIHFLA